jgi:sugar lactone lactonase YvrE
LLLALPVAPRAQSPVASGNVITIAGNGAFGYSGDGGPATNATMTNPSGSAIGPDGTLYFADSSNFRLRAVAPGNGFITTLAGNGPPPGGNCDGYGTGDGGPATNASFCSVFAVAVDRARHTLYFADVENNRVRQVNLTNGLIANYAGTGLAGFGFSGDGGPATAAQVAFPQGVATDGAGRLYIADTLNNRIRQVNPVTGLITTIAGNGAALSAGDGGPATNASFALLSRVAADGAGNVFVADAIGGTTHVIRRVDAITGLITRLAGGGTNLPGTGPATNMDLGQIRDLAVDNAGTLYLANPTQVFKVDLATGQLTPFAGATNASYSGDGGPALDARFNDINGLSVPPGGGLVISDGNLRLRYVAPGSINLSGDHQQTAFYLPWVSALAGDFTVTGNSNLTTVSAGSLTNVGGTLSVENNTAAGTIDLSSLSVVDNNVSVSENTGAGSIDLGSLAVVGGTLGVDDNTAAGTIDLGSLSVVGGNVSVSDNTAAGTIDLGTLQIVGGSLTVVANSSASSVSLGSLSSVSNEISIVSNTSLTNVSAGSLTNVGGSVSIDGNSAATTIDIGLLASAGGNVSIDHNTSATVIDLGSLTTAGGMVTIDGNTAATVIDLGALANANGNVTIDGNTSAAVVDLGSLMNAGGSVTIDGNGAANVIGLGSLASAGGDVSIDGNEAATIIDLSSLTNAGGTVSIDGNTTATVIDLGSLSSVGGDVTITSNAPNVEVNLVSLCEFGDGTNATTMTLEGGTFAFTNCLTIGTNGTLSVSGTVDGTVTNAGTIAPGTSPGRFDLTGNLVLTPSSRLRLELGGFAPGQFDVIHAAGSVTLGGALGVSLINPFASVMTNGAAFTLLTAGSPLAGAFANVASGGTLTTTDGYARFTVLYAGQTSLQLTGLVIVDTDGDGLPDWWEDQFSLSKTNAADAALDLDGDGAANVHEFLAGTNPTNAASVFRVVAVEREGDGVRLTWSTVGGRSYRVQTNGTVDAPFSDLSPLITVPGAGESTTNFVDASAVTDAPARFYRVRLGP